MIAQKCTQIWWGNVRRETAGKSRRGWGTVLLYYNSLGEHGFDSAGSGKG